LTLSIISKKVTTDNKKNLNILYSLHDIFLKLLK
jgi:hypothetical protein